MTGRPRNNERRQERQDMFLAAFARTGVISQAAEQSGVVASQHHRWLGEDGSYASRFAELKEHTAGIALTSRRKPGLARGQTGERRVQRKHANQERFLEALAKTGIILDAVRETGLSQTSHNSWMRTDPEYAESATRIISEAYDVRRKLITERQSASKRAGWDRKRRARWSEFQKAAWTPQMRAEASRRNSERMSDPDKKANWEVANRARWNNPEAREQNTERMRRLWADPAYRERVLASMRSPERRRSASEQMKLQWAQVSPEERREIMRKRRAVFKGGFRLTQIEATVISALNEMDVLYQIHRKVDSYIADILTGGLVIECDGAWFHDRRKDTDETRDKRLAELGYRVLRLPEREIEDGSFIRKLQEALK